MAIGVTGEAIVGVRLFFKNNALHHLQEEQIAVLRNDAARAQLRAAEMQASFAKRASTISE